MKKINENRCTSKYFLVIVLKLILLFSLVFPLKSNGAWELIFQPRQRVVKSIGIFHDLIFAGTGNGVLVSKDEGKTWKDFGSNQLQRDPNGNSVINWIYIDEVIKRIYIATSFGAYYSYIENPSWEKIFDSTKIESSEVNSLTVDDKDIYLSTNDGFWKCQLESGGKVCERLNQGLKPDSLSGNHEIFYSLKFKDDLFLATANGIYILNKGRLVWEEISDGIQSLPNGRTDAKHLFIDKEDNLWAACGTGVYFYHSVNKGKDWKKRSNGIKKNSNGFQEVNFLFESDKELYLAGASGIYFLNENNDWIDITGGIRTKEDNKKVYYLSNINSKLLAGSDEGLFVANELSYHNKSSNNGLVLKGKIESDFANLEELEPSVIDVQKQALKFASLPTTKDYKRYRAQARFRNLFPRVGFDVNNTGTSTDYYQFEKGIKAGASINNSFDATRLSRYQEDGKSFKQLAVVWNTNQFIYDDEIREILNQARLTANIKENLLDDVTRIYFQRKRLLLDNLISPSIEPEEKLVKELEIAEITGQLDSRTGGWFSKEVSKRKQIKNGSY